MFNSSSIVAHAGKGRGYEKPTNIESRKDETTTNNY